MARRAWESTLQYISADYVEFGIRVFLLNLIIFAGKVVQS